MIKLINKICLDYRHHTDMADSSKTPILVKRINVVDDEKEYIVHHLPSNVLGSFKPNPKDCIPVKTQEKMVTTNPINRMWLEARERDMKKDS